MPAPHQDRAGVCEQPALHPALRGLQPWPRPAPLHGCLLRGLGYFLMPTVFSPVSPHCELPSCCELVHQDGTGITRASWSLPSARRHLQCCGIALPALTVDGSPQMSDFQCLTMGTPLQSCSVHMLKDTTALNGLLAVGSLC